MNIERLTEQLKKDEGFSEYPFWDRKQWTWGYGTAAPGFQDREFYIAHAKPRIKERKAEKELHAHILIAIKDYNDIFGHLPISEVRKEALVNMLFNMGRHTFMKFKNTIKHIINNEWKSAAFEAYNSKWYNQVGTRSYRIVRELAYGEKH